MRSFTCQRCGQLVFFDNSACLRCGAPLGVVPERRDLATLEPKDGGRYTASAGPPGVLYRRCAAEVTAACNWLVPDDGGDSLCRSCGLTRTRPADADPEGLAAMRAAEDAKRRLVFQIDELGLPLTSRREDPERGLAFDLLASRGGAVTTGHAGGVITLDLSESDDAHREAVRQELGEPYRTVLGHLRHEIGHYYWPVLVERPGRVEEFRSLFGDERLDYGEALDRHYAEGPPPDWRDRYVSAYATMHPWEDWAETFAHYLHIRDTLQTAAAFGMRVAVGGSALASEPRAERDEDLAAIVGQWLPLTYALNAVNRSMGRDDLYPFVLGPAILAKLDFVHRSAG